MSNPKVSVVMSVYNDEDYIQEAVDSILNQTFCNFEFIIVNDGSTDKTPEILRSYNDERIILLDNPKNVGVSVSMNRGIEIAKGQYIAHIGGDDISFPERLEKQVCFLDEHPNVGLISSSAIFIDKDGKEIGLSKLPTDNEEIKRILYKEKGCAIWHTSATFRSDCIAKVGKYREWFKSALDYDLWLRIGEHYDLANIGEPLCKVRIVRGSLSTEKRAEQLEFASFAHLFSGQRRVSGYDELYEASKSWIVRKRLNSRLYLGISKQYHTEGMKWDPKSSAKFIFKSLLSNPFNLNAWSYLIFLFKNKIRTTVKKMNLGRKSCISS